MPTGPCAVCGTSAKAFCSKCKQVYYCCAEHQRQDWKSHKAACKAFCEAGGAAGPSSEQAPEPSGGGGTCARCLEPCGKGKCCVPHPVHLREFGGGFYGAGGMQFSYACGACSQSYTEVTPSGSTAPPKITGAVWCFDGRHSAGPLPAGDKRRVFRNAVTLTAGANLQRQIDELPADTEILNIVSTGTFDDKNRVALARPLPNLTELHLVDVAFSRVVLTAETTPKLHTLQMQNVPESCELEVVLPELRDVTVHYWGGDAGVMERMLQAATKLEEFDSYKLWSNNELTFASAALRSINLHRADTLGSLTVWAPNLVNLNLQACDLEEMVFLDTHELAPQMGSAARPCTEPLRVNVLNANLSEEAMEALYAHPRAEVEGDEDGEEGGGMGGGPSMAAMLAALRAQGMQV